jgi:glycosyltransferase 2 family protein
MVEPNPKAGGRRVRRAVQVLLPLVVMVGILWKVDLEVLASAVLEASVPIAVLGVLLVPLRNLLAALRWRLLLAFAFPRALSTLQVLRTYWIGTALGFFTPASAGLDAYRMTAAARVTGAFPAHLGIVLTEKLLAVGSCAVLVLAALGLLIAGGSDVAGLTGYGTMAAGLLGGLTLLGLGAVLAARWEQGRNALEALGRRLGRPIRQQVAKRTAGRGEGMLGLRQVRALASGRRLTAAFGVSVSIQLAAAAGNMVMFWALGHHVPFVVHLFVVPMLYLIFALPISMGSLGIREGAFILLYGLFGVPAETALLASLLNLVGILLNNGLGAAVMWSDRKGSPERLPGPTPTAS